MTLTDRRAGWLAWSAAAVLVLAGLALLVAGLYGRGGPPAAGPGATVSQSVPRLEPLPRSVPVRLLIPSLGIDAPVIPEGLDADGALAAPPLAEHNLTGWYEGGAAPGELGPAVIEGHVDSKSGPSVFYRLGTLSQGARVEVVRRDGRRVIFQVDTLQQVAKDAFPTSKVYGPVPYSALRLITCGGTFNPAKGSYTDNIIVYAHRIA